MGMASVKDLEDQVMGRRSKRPRGGDVRLDPTSYGGGGGRGRSPRRSAPAEDDPGFEWWKQGNRTASVGTARRQPPPEPYTTSPVYRNAQGRRVVSTAPNKQDSMTARGEDVTVSSRPSRRPGRLEPRVRDQGSAPANRSAVMRKANAIDERRIRRRR